MLFFSKDPENSIECDDFLWPYHRGLIPTGEKFYDDKVKSYSPKISSYGINKRTVAFFYSRRRKKLKNWNFLRRRDYAGDLRNDKLEYNEEVIDFENSR